MFRVQGCGPSPSAAPEALKQGLGFRDADGIPPRYTARREDLIQVSGPSLTPTLS